MEMHNTYIDLKKSLIEFGEMLSGWYEEAHHCRKLVNVI